MGSKSSVRVIVGLLSAGLYKDVLSFLNSWDFPKKYVAFPDIFRYLKGKSAVSVFAAEIVFVTLPGMDILYYIMKEQEQCAMAILMTLRGNM